LSDFPMLSNEMIVRVTALLVPGYIFNYSLNLFSPRKESNPPLKLLALGLINYSICYFLFEEIKGTVSFLLQVFLSPLLLGSIWSIFTHLGLVKKILNGISLNPRHSCPTSWDYVFNKFHSGARVIIKLRNGSNIYGEFSSNSFSADSNFKDIYIEKFFKICEETHEWQEVLTNKGIYINDGEISTIEFFD